MDVGTMWAGILQETDQAMTLIAHAEAKTILNEVHGRSPGSKRSTGGRSLPSAGVDRHPPDPNGGLPLPIAREIQGC